MPDYETLLEGYGFGRVRRVGDELNADCALCGDRSRKFYLNTRKGMAICFHGCFAGSSVALVARLEGINLSEARGIVEAGGDWYSRVRRAFAKPKRREVRRTEVRYPGARGLNDEELRWIDRRKLSRRVARDYGAFGSDDTLGLISVFHDCERDEAALLQQLYPRRFDYLRGRIYWPVILDDGLLSFEGRSIGSSFLKVVYPSGVNVKQSLFGIEEISGREFVVLVEGVLDNLTLGGWDYPSVASFSAGISVEQTARLLKFNRVYCAYDNDEGGRQGLEGVVKRLAGGSELLRVVLPDGKDPNDCSHAEFTFAFVGAKPYYGNPLNRLKRR